jgi:hypothetical protein
MGASPDLAEGCVNDAFLAVALRWPRLRGSNPAAFARTVEVDRPEGEPCDELIRHQEAACPAGIAGGRERRKKRPMSRGDHGIPVALKNLVAGRFDADAVGRALDRRSRRNALISGRRDRPAIG